MFDIVTDPAAYPLEFETALNRGDLERLAALYASRLSFEGSPTRSIPAQPPFAPRCSS